MFNQTLVEKDPLIKKLSPHETEIFHIKPANPTRPQYIGSDLHFSCGFEVQSFEWCSSHIDLTFKNEYDKTGSVFLYIPEPGSSGKTLDNLSALTNGEASRVDVVARPAIHNNKTKNFHAGVVVKIRVHCDGSQNIVGGQVKITW